MVLRILSGIDEVKLNILGCVTLGSVWTLVW